MSRRVLLAETPPESITDFTLYFMAALRVLLTKTSIIACWVSVAIAVFCFLVSGLIFFKSRVKYSTAVLSAEKLKSKFFEFIIGLGSSIFNLIFFVWSFTAALSMAGPPG